MEINFFEILRPKYVTGLTKYRLSGNSDVKERTDSHSDMKKFNAHIKGIQQSRLTP